MKFIAIALLAATLSAQEIKYCSMTPADNCLIAPPPIADRMVFDNNGALEAFYTHEFPKHHWYASKRFWVPVGAIAAGFAIGVIVNTTRSAGPMYHSAPLTQYSAPVPQQPGIVDVTHIGIGGPGIPVVIVHGGLN